MPQRSKSICSYPGCNTVTRQGKCEKHRKRVDHRPNANKRGYDNKWHKLRNAYIRAHPICQIQHYCDGAPAEMVDHIVPIRAGGERLNEDNLQSCCNRCHAWKTRTQDAEYYQI